MAAASSPTENKRDSFRIDRDIHFEFRPCSATFVEDNDVDDAFDDDDDGSRLICELSKIDQGMLSSLGAIGEKNRFLGDVLKAMNAKIDAIGRTIAFDSESSLRSRPKTRVSISSSGISFVSSRSFYKGNFIAARMIFLPNYVMASSFAEIVRCEQKDDKFLVAAKFHQISDEESKTISRFLLKSQVKVDKKT